jgi:hypothetical protein
VGRVGDVPKRDLPTSLALSLLTLSPTRIVLDVAIVASVAAPVLWALGVWRWRKLKRQAERFRKGGGLP